VRETRQHVPRTLGLIVLRLMTWEAIRVLQLIVAANVALYALRRRVPASQWKARCRMIERCRRPRRLRMARETIVAELTLLMVRIGCLIEIRRMTIKARVGQLILIVHMTLIARHGLMCTDQRKSRVRMAECRWSPHRRVMTGQTIISETRQHMPWTLRLIVLRLMTGETIRVQQLIVAANVALHALGCRMSARQRQSRRCMVKRCRTPRRLRVAREAVMTELTLLMTWIRCLIKISHVTIETCVR
jgi:hypothetical protein